MPYTLYHLESQVHVIMGYFVSIMGYFGLWWPTILGYLESWLLLHIILLGSGSPVNLFR